MTPEGQLKADVVKLLKQFGCLWFRMQSGQVKVRGAWMSLCKLGTADTLIFLPERVCWLELKVVGQKTAKDRVKAQADFAEEVRALGHEYRICTTTDEVIDYLKGVR